ncbi:glycosyltransferase family 2 protein [Alcaligenaceae bacterium CGII-47]|nr:glycosyltransferase family 2 protein [Alcaligenaceae bacterium CGII-47]
MKYSLILCTINRKKEVINLLNSLVNQTYKDFELIIVDQNDPDYLNDVISIYNKKLKIKRIYSEIGLSRARNTGLKACNVNTDVVCFPDDDCEYFTNVLEMVENAFLSSNSNIVIGRSVDKNGEPSCIPFSENNKIFNVNDIISHAISYTIFIKIRDKSDIVFDEDLGVGSGSGFESGEETDCLLNLYSRKYIMIHNENVLIYHPNKTWKKEKPTRALEYGRGFGYVLRKNRVSHFILIRVLFRPLIGIVLSLISFNSKRAKYYLNSFAGRLIGMFSRVR